MQGRFENDILGLVPKEDWLTVGFDVERPSDPIDTLFGDEKTDNLVAKWNSIAAEYQIPVMAQFHGFDTESLTTFRVPVDTHNIEKGLIKVKLNQSERMRALLRSGVQNDEMYDYVVNDGVRLVDQVFTRSKVAKNELMATGQVTIKENNLDLTVDYGVPAAQKAYTINTSGDIPGQIQTIIDAAAAKGVVINGMMASSQVITAMRKNSSVQTAINGTAASGATVRRSAFYDYLAEEFGIIEVKANDLTYGASASVAAATGLPAITTKRYYPVNKVTFYATNPGGRLGIGLWGDPPEIDDYEVNPSAGDKPFVIVSQWFEKDPHVMWTKASALFMPVLYNPNSLFIASVTSTGA